MHRRQGMQYAKYIFVITGIAISSAYSNQVLARSAAKHDTAKVTHVEPVYETIERSVPQQHCWTERVREHAPASYSNHRSEHKTSRSGTSTLVGGIIGGVIGNEVGRGGDNKKIGAVVGSLLGMSIANDIHRRHQHSQSASRHQQHQQVHYRDVQRCETSHQIETEEVLQGYNVEYRYHGQTYYSFMNQRPGKRLRVAVNVQPVGY